MYGEDIPRVVRESATSEHALWKLHGDIADPEERWVLPFEAGRVFSALEQLALRTTLPAIVIGYREQESVVREKLITVLEHRAGVTRVRPDLTNNLPESFADSALWAMKKLKATKLHVLKSIRTMEFADLLDLMNEFGYTYWGARIGQNDKIPGAGCSRVDILESRLTGPGF